nr:hypothetical protein Iba_chr09aCG2570 [Ipomoea batatas]GMD36739.1 hypothetical protein Iba_chr09eCG2830 [Ipomoea batatas]GMD38359.1 hypothetical protein Iba_chr09fCG3190 [Ipomoea batatas]
MAVGEGGGEVVLVRPPAEGRRCWCGGAGAVLSAAMLVRWCGALCVREADEVVFGSWEGASVLGEGAASRRGGCGGAGAVDGGA